jgi:BirA family biotin operon repressor/biotin-[acetyl-CoA-carboxylase] ligase
MTVYSGVPIAEAIETVTGVPVEVKWPNDVEVESKKVGGILVEGVSKLNQMDFVVVGVGINANAPVPGELPEAGSLGDLTGKKIDLEKLLSACLERFDAFYSDLGKGELPEREYKERSSVIGAQVEASIGNQTIAGKALRVNKDGSLTVRSEEGPLVRLGWVSDTTLRVVGRRDTSRKDYYRKHNSFR